MKNIESFNDFIQFEIFSIGKYHFTFGILINVVIIISVTFLVLFLIRKVLFRKKVISKFEKGNLYSFYQIIRYLIWIISIMLILDTLGLKLNALLAGSAALLVGVGLGLQNTFNNFISGLIILFEGTLKVGDVIEIDGEVVKMERIGMRTSSAINRDDIIIIIPNYLITSNKVINWSHQSEKTRFRINVGVAYGSDIELVTKLLEESAHEHVEEKDHDSVKARFIDFGNSSLDFELLFFSNHIFRIETMKSDIRKTINKKFTDNNITIPFPQMDLHIKTNK